jgi:hypothetical protein
VIPQADTDAISVVRRVLGSRLPGGPPLPAGLRLTQEVIDVATADRVQGLLWPAVEAGLVRGNEELVDRARDAYLEGLANCLAAEETAVLTLDALASVGVEARVIKGVAVAHLDHADPAERMFADADLLIRPADYDLAMRALTDAGFGRALPPVRSWWERRFGKSIVMYPPDGSELDLHIRITGGYFGELIDHDQLWSRSGTSFTLGGRKATALDREGRLLHACCHATLGGRSGLRALHDIAQLVLVSGADWADVAERARRGGHDLVIAEGLRVAWSTFDLDAAHPAAAWAAGHTADDAQLRALVAYRSAIGGEGWAPEGRSILSALGPVDQVRFLAGLALPSRASLRARRRTSRSHLRRGLTSIFERR